MGVWGTRMGVLEMGLLMGGDMVGLRRWRGRRGRRGGMMERDLEGGVVVRREWEDYKYVLLRRWGNAWVAGAPRA